MTKVTQNEAERVWLAPMSGSTDAAFRRQAVKFGCPAVVSEMVAGEALLANRADVVRRICRHDGAGRWIVQLAARRPEHMKAASALLVDLGVDLIDINMGCPSRQVTGGKSGSALMREPDRALRIIDAALEGAGDVPVSLKMRLGWDHDMLNAPELAAQATGRGICHITVHGRTRCQFYKGQADWTRINDTVEAVDVPVIANGDICDISSAKAALAASGAYGVMIGRAAMGRPWLPGLIHSALSNSAAAEPSQGQQADSLCEQIEDSLTLYGTHLGLRMVRKHVAAWIDHLRLPISEDARRAKRAALCQITDPAVLMRDIQLMPELDDMRVAA